MVGERKDPLADLLALREKMNHLFEEALLPDGGHAELVDEEWRPLADVFETARELIICVDLPGVDREAIDVAFERDTIRVQGERKELTGVSADCHRRERPQGRFSLRFPLPVGWDAERIEASHQDGVLRIRVPRLLQAATRGIEIR